MHTLPIKETVYVFTSSEILNMQDVLSYEDLNKDYIDQIERKNQIRILNNSVREFLSSPKKELLKVKYFQTDNEGKMYFLVKYMDYLDE